MQLVADGATLAAMQGHGPMPDHSRLENLLLARTPCVRIVTTEEADALEAIRGAALIAAVPVQTWSIINGVRADDLADQSSIADTENPGAALVHWARTVTAEAPAVCVCFDLAPHLEDARVMRALRDLVERFNAINHDTPRVMMGNGVERPTRVTLVIIDSTNTAPDLLKSFAIPYDLPQPTDQEVEDLAKKVLRRLNKDKPLKIDLKVDEWGAVLKNLRGLSRRQMEQLLSEVVVPEHRLTAEELHDVLAAKRRMFSSTGMLEFVETPATLDSVGGLWKLKAWLKDRDQAFSAAAAEFGLTAPRGILMLGVQGAGKSLCAKAIATAWRRPLLRLDPGALYDRYVGESERRLRDTLAQAERMAPIVVWIDEIEKGFASAASQSTDGGLSQRMFGTLLSWMQEHHAPVFLVATANNIEALPPELMRKGRFDEIFFVDLPGNEARREIWAIHLKKRKRDPEKFNLPTLVAASYGFSGAEIEQAVIAGMTTAFATKADVTTEGLLAALRETRPLSVTMREKVTQLRLWAAERCCSAE
jgi:ATP-dependent 26S proteasome regulatory subunit